LELVFVEQLRLEPQWQLEQLQVLERLERQQQELLVVRLQL
jgi:hypothetical protein